MFTQSAKNSLKLGTFCVILGMFATLVIWLFLKILGISVAFLWERIPSALNLPFYTVFLCTLGGLIIGLFRKKYGDYPEVLEVVMGKVKKNKTYDYKKMPILMTGAFLPLLFGASIGPEAGMTGMIVGLCYWAGNNIKFAQKDAKTYSEIGSAVTLSLLFHSPLFGIFAVEEDPEESIPSITKGNKIFLYGLAIAGSTVCFLGLNHFFGAPMSGFPSFLTGGFATGIDYLSLLLYIPLGCLLAVFFKVTMKGCGTLSGHVPPVVSETAAGFLLGIVGTVAPIILFSGEEQMGFVKDCYGQFLPFTLIGIAFLKVFMTAMCIQFGLKGGHFFPIIFAGIALGYGTAMAFFPDPSSHVVFAAAAVTAALLGGVMRKPIAVTMVLFLCFPAKNVIWIFLSALLGTKLSGLLDSKAGRVTEA